MVGLRPHTCGFGCGQGGFRSKVDCQWQNSMNEGVWERGGGDIFSVVKSVWTWVWPHLSGLFFSMYICKGETCLLVSGQWCMTLTFTVLVFWCELLRVPPGDLAEASRLHLPPSGVIKLIWQVKKGVNLSWLMEGSDDGNSGRYLDIHVVSMTMDLHTVVTCKIINHLNLAEDCDCCLLFWCCIKCVFVSLKFRGTAMETVICYRVTRIVIKVFLTTWHISTQLPAALIQAVRFLPSWSLNGSGWVSCLHHELKTHTHFHGSDRFA